MPEDKGCYILYNVDQGSDDWKYMRKGKITMSNIGKVVGHAPYYKGTKYEPKVRNILAKKLNCEISETGFAVWKKDPRFGASLDGIIDDECGIEIKCPARMYGPILNYMRKKNPDPDDISHIWKSQYDQVIGNGVITGRKWMFFCVYGIEDKLMFIQKVKVDYRYWKKELYRPSVEFYENYMEPIINEK